MYCNCGGYHNFNLDHFLESFKNLNDQWDKVLSEWLTLKPQIDDNIIKNIEKLFFEMYNDGRLDEIISSILYSTPDKRNYIALNLDIDIICAGDSITIGVNPANGTGIVANPYPKILQETLQNCGYKAKVYNKGWAGDTSDDALTKFNEFKTTGTNAQKLIIWQYGTNDVNHAFSYKKMSGNLMKFRDMCAKNDVGLLVITMPPVFSGLDRANRQRQANDVLIKTCQQNDIAYLNLMKICDILYNSGRYTPYSMQTDGTHFIDYSFIAQSFMAKVMFTCVDYILIEGGFFLRTLDRKPVYITDGSSDGVINNGFRFIKIPSGTTMSYRFWIDKDIVSLGMYSLKNSSYGKANVKVDAVQKVSINTGEGTGAGANIITSDKIQAGYHIITITAEGGDVYVAYFRGLARTAF